MIDNGGPIGEAGSTKVLFSPPPLKKAASFGPLFMIQK